MARRSRRLNPDDARTLGRDIDDVIGGSGSAIDAVYEEYKQVNRDLDRYEDIKANLEENEQSIPRKLRAAIAENKLRLRELDRRIAQYSKIMLRRVKERMDIIRNSPGASFNRDQIRDVDRAIFKVEKKAKNRGADIRMDLAALMGAVVTLEQDSGIVIRKPGKKVDETSRRKTEEAQLYAGLVDQWKKVYRHAKKDPRVQEDVEWVTTQLRGLDVKFRRGESIRRGIERVAKRIKDIHNRTKPRRRLKTFADAKKGVRDFVVVIQEYSQGDVTAAGIDRLERELADFAAQFSAKEKAEWGRGESREFGRDIRNIRKALEKLRPKRGRKKNPCIGLHFHGKDSDELLKALEESADRQTKKAKKNPRGGYDFVESFVECDDRTIPKTAKAIDKKIAACKKELRDIRAQQTVATRNRHYDLSEKMEQASADIHEFVSRLYAAKRKSNPKKKAAKKKSSKKTTRKTSPSQNLIKRCQKLWDAYCEKPTKKNLRAVLEHLEKMKESSAKSVKSERARCLRVANKEAKRLKVK